MRFLLIFGGVVVGHMLVMSFISSVLHRVSKTQIEHKDLFSQSAVLLLADAKKRAALFEVCENSDDQDLKLLQKLIYFDYGILGIGALLTMLFWFRII
jgi:hypothetical protein